MSLSIQEGVDLSALNTLGFAAQAERFVRVDKVEELPQLHSYLQAHPQPVLLLGGGSNLVLGEHIPGLVVQMAIQGWELLSEAEDEIIQLRVMAGESWHSSVEKSLQQGLYGLENLALIPGTVGAAPIQNIGAYGVELKDRVHSIQAFDRDTGDWCDLTPADCAFAYRESRFKSLEPGRYWIWAVTFTLSRRPCVDLSYQALAQACGSQSPTPWQVFEAVCRLRRAKLPDPKVLGNVGSFFKNPLVSASQYERLLRQFPDLVAYAEPSGGYKLAAGWLIDACGWKGKRREQVGVHTEQALVLVHYGQARREELLALAAEIQKDVLMRFGVELEQEPLNYPAY
ncbi:UDP-N-acetylmuramate dehydrogenase [Nitrincola tapanii]|uniref:UDP-N-acetylenolpyruvoylglucosamine reductase n=1 Tax=Nitrincola tapanii TaxID=1708751 RepID=A0A5A9W4A1_9GAMM|nr:UDP-N-acetylmuramate dehydrogenase [Nitrincola tapanii]KAA0875343.1 UDP-N-acetylmuramate dehydrogenase [Nitrincola tapanii]